MTAPDWRAIERHVRAIVRRRVEPQWVDDVVGGVLLRLVRRTRTLMLARNQAAFVQRAAANAVTDHYRRRATERRALEAAAQDVGGHVEARSGEDPSEALSRCLVPFIERLPRRYNEALRLTEIEQMSRKDAARRLGLSASGLKSRVQRGRELLKTALARCCAIERDAQGRIMDYARRPNASDPRC